MPDVPETLANVENALKSVADALLKFSGAAATSSKSTNNLAVAQKKFVDSMNKSSASTPALTKRAKALKEAYDAVASSMGDVVDEQSAMAKSGSKNEKNLGKLKVSLDTNRKAYEALAVKQKVVDVSLKKMEKSVGNATEKWKEYREAKKGVADQLKKTGQALAKYGSLLGGQSMSVSNIIKKTQEYNKSMFALRRTQQVAGRGMADINLALRSVSKNTVLSRQDFLDFSNSMTSLYKGAIPTSREMAKFAAILEKKFGPNVDLIKSKMQSLMQIQSKLPSLYQQIRDAADASAKGEFTRASALTASSLAQMQMLGMTKEQMITVAQFTSKTTKEQEKQIKVNRDIAKATQASQDALIKLGQAAEWAMSAGAKAVETFYDAISLLSPAVIALGIALAGLKIHGATKAAGLAIKAAQVARTAAVATGVTQAGAMATGTVTGATTEIATGATVGGGGGVLAASAAQIASGSVLAALAIPAIIVAGLTAWGKFAIEGYKLVKAKGQEKGSRKELAGMLGGKREQVEK